MDTINVQYQAEHVGVLSFDESTGYGAFEYHKNFISKGIELSPIHMPLSDQVYIFPRLNYQTFKGLNGMVADSLPDDFGNRILNAWITAKGRSPISITPIERLRYTGSRGMGALEYSPANRVSSFDSSKEVEINELVKIAQEILDDRNELNVTLDEQGESDQEAMLALLSVGTSAGGARPKAVLAFNESLTQVRSGQSQVPEGFTHYLMKFDGVSEHNTNKETFGDPMGFGAMEYVYSIMAKNCGIHMMPCKLLNEGDRRHFLTQRFDRQGNEKIHVQSLNGIAHVDYKMPGSYSYEQLIMLARELRLSPQEAMELFKRMVFNIVARNHDDHSKNFAFILEDGKWKLAPAYDLAFSYKPGSAWVNSHWMALGGKRDNFELNDFLAFEKLSPIFTRAKIISTIEEITEQVSQWRRLASNENVPEKLIAEVETNLRLNLA